MHGRAGTLSGSDREWLGTIFLRLLLCAMDIQQGLLDSITLGTLSIEATNNPMKDDTDSHCSQRLQRLSSQRPRLAPFTDSLHRHADEALHDDGDRVDEVSADDGRVSPRVVFAR